jgi:hypothetical protein
MIPIDLHIMNQQINSDQNKKLDRELQNIPLKIITSDLKTKSKMLFVLNSQTDYNPQKN